MLAGKYNIHEVRNTRKKGAAMKNQASTSSV